MALHSLYCTDVPLRNCSLTPLYPYTTCSNQALLGPLRVVPGASCYAVCGWLELLAAD